MADQWYVAQDGNQQGPFTASEVRQKASRGEIKPTDMVWKQGMAKWVPASAIKGLFAQQASPPARRPGSPTTQSDPVNPYAAPSVSDFQAEAGLSESDGDPMQYAEYFPRVGAFLLDVLFVNLLGCIPSFGIGFVLVGMAAANDPESVDGMVVFANLCSTVVNLVIGFLYYVLLESSLKQGTWGKQIVGIKVTDLEGQRITAGRAIGRWAAKFITGCTLGIGLLMPLFTEKKQTLHDMIAGCLALNK